VVEVMTPIPGRPVNTGKYNPRPFCWNCHGSGTWIYGNTSTIVYGNSSAVGHSK
jgi:hypothetical protein